ncbi:MliC family protein [Devosia sp. A8/3-2]|nr:MliC family protein [Devosia sp. A8/3-2]
MRNRCADLGRLHQRLAQFPALVNVPEETEKLVFASTVSASGVRYVSGQWARLTQGAEASLHDTTLGEDAPAVSTCSEASNAP